MITNYGFWICPNCKASVPTGTSHACTPMTYTYSWSPVIDEETKSLLRRIADGIDELVKQGKEKDLSEFARNQNINT